MITMLALFPLARVSRDWSGLYLFIRDGLMGALVVGTFVSACTSVFQS